MKKYYRLHFTFLTVFLGIILPLQFINAQQIPQFTQYILNPFIINPAFAGTTAHFDIKASYRKQWMGITDAPTTMYLTFHSHLGKHVQQGKRKVKNAKTSHHGLGATLLKDQTGPLNTLRANLTYCYDLALNKNIRLSMGVSAGLKNFYTDLDAIKLNDNTNNVAVSLTNLNSYSPDLNMGLYLYSEKFFVGLSAQNLLFNAINGSIYGLESSVFRKNNFYAQHLYLLTGYAFAVGDNLHIIPSILTKYSFNTPKPSFDFNLKIKYETLFWGGVNVRSSDAFSLFIGTLLSNKYEVSVSYDYGFTNIAAYTSGSIEMMLGYRIYPKMKVKSPSDYW